MDVVRYQVQQRKREELSPEILTQFESELVIFETSFVTRDEAANKICHSSVSNRKIRILGGRLFMVQVVGGARNGNITAVH